jgi:Trk K+ transport system NAD-binding subunit
MKPLPEWAGKSLAKLRLRQTERMNVLMIIREGEIMAVLDAQTVLKENDDLIVLKSRY